MRIDRILIMILLIVNSCSKPEEITIHKIISGVDNVSVSSNRYGFRCISRHLANNEISYLKDTIGDSYIVLDSVKITPKHLMTLYQGDSIIGHVSVDSAIGNRLRFTNTEFAVSIEIEYNLGKYLDSLTNIDNIDCSDCHKHVNLDSVTVQEFIEMLPVKNPEPFKIHFMSVWGNVDSNWITKEDIAYMIPLLDRTDSAYCTGSPISSHFYVGENDYSTLGGQVMNLIDYYRLDKVSPIYHPTCYKNDADKKREILKWWENER